MTSHHTTPNLAPLPENPLVSVIIPSYNSRQWVGKALDSVLGQTYQNIEIIVVDDGSSDATGDFIKEHYGDNNRVCYFYTANGGVSHARNFGIRQATGDLLSFLDADDWILPEKVAHQVDFLKAHPEYQIAYCDFWNAYDREGPLETPTGGWLIKGVSGHILPDLLARTVVIMHAVLVRRECFETVGDFKEDLSFAEDWEFWMRLAGLGYQFGFLPEREVVYYIRPGSRSTDNYRVQLCRNRICRYIAETINPAVLKDALQESGVAATFQFGLARAYFEQKRNWAGFKQTLVAIKTPRSSRRLVYVLFCLGYLAAIPFLGYNRLEKLVMRLVEKLKIKI